ncbi:MAG: hypothetical protein K9J16_03115 [Melioribacteraceae bacterium]|nr:hypothetical protein [Melioribacteraceae bacterium]MCF8353533.1 hypothetical protein [Melioribacteraceae bacterium]MCF8392533.1 hypothetical protein [Melioribacteraceae bacterium]MCF8418452.1 hypothetical protein [Melioribacteraceae bacterium]
MPVLKSSNEKFPDWSEVKYYEILGLKAGQVIEVEMKYQRETLFVVKGSCEVIKKGLSSIKQYGGKIEFAEIEKYSINALIEDCAVIRIAGKWGDECGFSGVFELSNSSNPQNTGDSTNYEHLRKTDFDNHFHDCDEFWIIYNGKGLIAIENNLFEVNPGYCAATKIGDHHDFIDINETFTGVYFETTLRGRRRQGHLWNHTHSNRG